MKHFTNHQAGPRGINLKDGSTRWIEPGETAEIDSKDIAGDLPDLGKARKPDTDDADHAAQVSDLEAARDAEKERADAAEAKHASYDQTIEGHLRTIDGLTETNAKLTQQVADLEAAAKSKKA